MELERIEKNILQSLEEKGAREMWKKALALAREGYGETKRIGGELWLEHGLRTAETLASFLKDTPSVLAALLHDIPELVADPENWLERIEKELGKEVRFLIEGVSELRATTQERFPYHQESIPNFRKFLLASISDVRVLIIRLVEKLDDGRTVWALPEEKVLNYGKRIFHLYSPLAEFIGLSYIKRKLDDIAFSILYPQEFSWLKNEIESREELEQLKERLIEEVREILESERIRVVDIFGRAKSYWSVWDKIQRYIAKGKISKEDPSVILDQLGITVLVENISSCYSALGVIHTVWPCVEGEFDDYISRPKPNGYRALHTVIEWEDRVAEIQIKTPEMHEYNEFGPASHIAYKMAGSKSVVKGDYSWVRDLVYWKEEGGERRYQIKVFTDFVYVFTPKGDIVQLKKGSTPVDFAFKIHTEIGLSCVGAKVNGKIVPLDYQLQNGEVVEILTQKGKKTPSPKWLSFVKMRETRSAIRRALQQSSSP